MEIIQYCNVVALHCCTIKTFWRLICRLSFYILLQSHKCVWGINKEVLWFPRPEEAICLCKSYNSAVDHTAAAPNVKEISQPETELI